ncbi:MAG: FtsX-like permease family protein [Gemmatimonadota bacterium]
MPLNPRPWIVPAVSALRTYWLTALLLAGAGALGLALLLPITSLAGANGLTGSSRLLMWAAPMAESGLHWSELSRTPTATGQLAIDRGFELLLLGAGFALAVAGLTILTFSAVREGQREVELSVRRAVGASRRVLLASSVLESGVLITGVVLLGGAGGALAAAAAIRSWPGMLGAAQMGATLAAVAAIGSGILFGAIVPVVFARRRQVLEAVSRPVPLAIPALQLGLSLAVLTAGALVARYALETGSGKDTGATSMEDRTLYQVGTAGMTSAERSAGYGALLASFHSGTGTSASLASRGSLMGLGTVDMIITDCGDCAVSSLKTRFKQVMTTQMLVSADTFRALSIKLVAGRLLTDADKLGSERVVVINRAMAAETFQYGQPLGRGLRLTNDDQWYTVVGVVDDPARAGFGAGLQPRYTAYLSVQQQAPAGVELMVGSGPPGPSDDAVRGKVRSTLGASAKVTPVHEADLLTIEAAPLIWLARRFAFEGWGMLVLAGAALLALMRLWVASLENELGVRRALGATRRRLWLMIVARTAIVGVAGIAVGIWFGPAIWVGLQDLLPGLPEWDPALLVRYALLLFGAAAAGSFAPAYLVLRRVPADLIGSHGG